MVVMSRLLTCDVLVGLDVVNAMISEFGDVGEGNYGLLDAVTYIVYTITRRAYTMFPTVAVIGALMALGQLAASSELTALPALGLSRRRLSLSVAAPVVVRTARLVVNCEPLGPWGRRRAP